MLNRLIRASQDFAQRKETQSEAWRVFARDTASGFVTTMHHTFMILGISAIAALALMFVRPEITDHLKALSPFTLATVQGTGLTADVLARLVDLPTPGPNDIIEARRLAAAPPPARLADEQTSPVILHQQERVTNWLSKKYRVAGDATDMLVSAAYETAREIKLDPLLILSVMAIESGFNPFAESPVGAKGLMQVMASVHHDKFQPLGGIKAALNPAANIRVGSLILKDYVTQGGSVEAGLKMYVGAAAFDTDFGYGSRVLAEYHRLKEVALGKNVPTTTPAYTAKARPAERAVEPQPVAPVSSADESAAANTILADPARTTKVAAL